MDVSEVLSFCMSHTNFSELFIDPLVLEHWNMYYNIVFTGDFSDVPPIAILVVLQVSHERNYSLDFLAFTHPLTCNIHNLPP